MGGCRASPGANSRRPEIAWERNVNRFSRRCHNRVDGVWLALCAELRWRGGRHTRGHQLSPGADARRCEMQWGLNDSGLLRQPHCTADSARGALCRSELSEGGRS